MSPNGQSRTRRALALPILLALTTTTYADEQDAAHTAHAMPAKQQMQPAQNMPARHDMHAGHDMTGKHDAHAGLESTAQSDPRAAHDTTEPAEPHAGHDMTAPQGGDAEHNIHAHHQQMMNQFLGMDTSAAPGGADIVIPDTRLTTQHNEEVLLASEVVGDRIVVMNFVYTTCTTVCPVLSAIFSQVADGLGERLGRDVVLVSLTVDPLRDTPEQLLAYSKKFRVEQGWTWLTSDKTTMDAVLKQLGSYTSNFEDHPSMVLVGDGSTGNWSRFVGFPGVDQILGKVDELVAARKMHQMHH